MFLIKVGLSLTDVTIFPRFQFYRNALLMKER